MSDFVNLKPFCPECGAELLVEQLGAEPKPEDMVSCPAHGAIGRRDEVTRDLLEKAQDDLGKQIGDDFEAALKSFGFDVNRG